jgi:uncharacterized protein YndB with AHSA1/START domain
MRRRNLVIAGSAALLSLAFARNALAEKPSGDTNVQKPPRDLVVVRTFNAPVDQVWRAWVDPELVKRWWGPDGWTCPVAKMDVRAGGTSIVAMRSPDGHDMYSTWAYTEVNEPRSFAYIFNLSDENGAKLDPQALGFPPDFPQDARHEVVIKDLGDGRTEMTMTEYGYTNDQLFDLSKTGLEQVLDKMAAIFT